MVSEKFNKQKSWGLFLLIFSACQGIKGTNHRTNGMGENQSGMHKVSFAVTEEQQSKGFGLASIDETLVNFKLSCKGADGEEVINKTFSSKDSDVSVEGPADAGDCKLEVVGTPTAKIDGKEQQLTRTSNNLNLFFKFEISPTEIFLLGVDIEGVKLLFGEITKILLTIRSTWTNQENLKTLMKSTVNIRNPSPIHIKDLKTTSNPVQAEPGICSLVMSGTCTIGCDSGPTTLSLSLSSSGSPTKSHQIFKIAQEKNAQFSFSILKDKCEYIAREAYSYMAMFQNDMGEFISTGEIGKKWSPPLKEINFSGSEVHYIGVEGSGAAKITVDVTRKIKPIVLVLAGCNGYDYWTINVSPNTKVTAILASGCGDSSVFATPNIPIFKSFVPQNYNNPPTPLFPYFWAAIIDDRNEIARTPYYPNGYPNNPQCSPEGMQKATYYYDVLKSIKEVTKLDVTSAQGFKLVSSLTVSVTDSTKSQLPPYPRDGSLCFKNPQGIWTIDGK